MQTGSLFLRCSSPLSLIRAFPIKVSPILWQSKQPISFSRVASCILTIAGFLLWHMRHLYASARELRKMNALKSARRHTTDRFTDGTPT
jgi:hypothetical protein